MKKKKTGFTLVEIIVVVLVIGIISFIAVPNIINLRNSANQMKLEKEKGLIKLAAENYALNNKNHIIKECEEGSSSCSVCEVSENCYLYNLNTQKLVDTNYLDKVNSELPQVSVILYGSDYSHIKSSVISIKRLKMNAVKFVKKLAGDNDEDSTDIIEAENDELTCTNTLAYDGTDDKNLRYVGPNPCNYVTFNGEKAAWRIIGIMNNIDDGTGKLESRIKLIRNNNIGEWSWDTAEAVPTNGTSGWGKNKWEDSKIKMELNGDYLNYNLSEDPYWYTGQNLEQKRQFDHTKVLKEDAQKYIGDALWHLTGHSSNKTTPIEFYEYERGDQIYGDWPKTWVGKVGLVYPSDVGYASGGSTRETCLNTTMDSYNPSCYNTTWLRFAGLTIMGQSNNYYGQFSMLSNLFTYYVHDGRGGTKPTVYLKSSVLITQGNGSQENPYELSLR